MVIFGALALLAACGSLYGIIVRRKPLLEIYRDGILTRHGHHPLFVHWKDYQRAQITGSAANWMLTLYGTFFHTKTNKVFEAVQFRQDRFIDTLQSIVATIEHFQRNPAAREQLPVRPSSNFPVRPSNWTRFRTAGTLNAPKLRKLLNFCLQKN